MDKKGIKTIFREIEIVKSELENELEKIDSNSQFSGEWKNELRMRAKAAALEQLQGINARAEKLVEAARAEQAEKSSGFDYSDERLAAAIRFVRDAGKGTPPEALAQIISDFGKRPSELKFIRDTLHESGAIAQAVAVDEAVKTAQHSASFWDRLGDGLYYACNSTLQTDFSGLEAELDGVTESE